MALQWVPWQRPAQVDRPPHRGRNARYVRSTSLLTVTRMSWKTTWMDTSTTVPRTPSLLSDLAPFESSLRHTHVLACTHLMHRHPCRSHVHLHCPGPMILCSLRNTPGTGFLPSPTHFIRPYLALWSRQGPSCKQWLAVAFLSESGLKGPRVKEASWGPRVLPIPGHSATCQPPPTYDIHTLMHTHTPLVPQSQFPGPPPSYLGSVCVYLPFPGVSLRQQHGCHSLFRSAVPTFIGSFLFPLLPSTPASTFLYG